MKHVQKLLNFAKPYWKEALFSFVLLVIMVVLDLAIPRLIQQIIDDGINQSNQQVVLRTSLLMLAISVVSTVIAVANNVYSIRVGEGVARDLREALFLKIQGFSFSNLDRFSTGKLMVRMSSDTGAFQRLVQITLRIGSRAPLMMVGSLILMFRTNQALAMTMLPLLLITLVVITIFSLRMEPIYRSVQQKLDRLNTVLQENLAGARLVKAFVRGAHEGERFEDANEDFTRRTITVMKIMSSVWPLLSMLVNIGIVLVIWSGGLEAIQGTLTIGEIVAFTNYMLTTMGPLTMMTMLSNVWANGIASAGRIDEVLETENEVADAPDAYPLPEPVRGRVVFENVSFCYNQTESSLVLEDINLEAEPGETVAILGATGSGKTTLVHLIPRFYDPTEGRITIDGHDIRRVTSDSLLAHVGIVPQETILFSGSVTDNIRYGRREASQDEVERAAKAAQAHDFILGLPQGYDTRVEERGVNLSGGQKQRIAIARALLSNPRILILDDSTSSVDVATETKIQAALKEWLHDTTTFVVAQRISTVLHADTIVVIDMGKIVARGSHAELMETSAIYQEIYDSQLGDRSLMAEMMELGPQAVDLPRNGKVKAGELVERNTPRVERKN